MRWREAGFRVTRNHCRSNLPTVEVKRKIKVRTWQSPITLHCNLSLSLSFINITDKWREMQEVSCNLHTDISVSCSPGDLLHVCRCTPKLVWLLLTPTEWVWHQHITYTILPRMKMVHTIVQWGFFCTICSHWFSCLHCRNNFPGGSFFAPFCYGFCFVGGPSLHSWWSLVCAPDLIT